MEHPENSEEYKGLQVNAGVSSQSIVNPYLKRGHFRRREYSAAEMVEDGLDSPTEFEVVMATAFLYFKSRNPDIVILEVGMGGIGDATNVIDKPLASVITSIGFDHMHVLGR